MESKSCSRSLRAAIHTAGLLYVGGLAALLIANHYLRQTSPFVAQSPARQPLPVCGRAAVGARPTAIAHAHGLATLLLLAVLFLSAHHVFPSASAVLPPPPEARVPPSPP